MRMATVDQLRSQIEILSQNHEREVDRKDAVIQALDRDLEDSEEQYGMALRGDMRVTQQLLDLQYQRMQVRGVIGAPVATLLLRGAACTHTWAFHVAVTQDRSHPPPLYAWSTSPAAGSTTFAFITMHTSLL